MLVWSAYPSYYFIIDMPLPITVRERRDAENDKVRNDQNYNEGRQDESRDPEDLDEF